MSKNDPTGHWEVPGLGTIVDIGFALYDAYTVIKNPTNKSKWISLGLDLAAAVVPFVPDGAGAAFRIADHIASIGKGATVLRDSGKVLDTVRSVEKGKDIVNGATNTKKTVGTIYRSFNESKDVNYVGQTTNFAQRQATHFRTTGREIKPFIQNVPVDDLRSVEQATIEKYGLGNLDNKINSISPKNPIYDSSLEIGNQYLDMLK